MSDTIVVGAEPTGPDAPNTATTTAPAVAAPPAAERPAWLPEKFKTPEDLSKAYASLESKLGGKQEAAAPPAEAVPPVPAPDSQAAVDATEKLKPFTEELTKEGKLSDDSYTKLNEMGYPRQMVDAYIAGQQAVSSNATSSLKAEIGGEESFNAMSDWAGNNLSDNELNAYNSLVQSGNQEQVRVAMKGLHARYIASVGTPPKLLHGSSSAASTTAPFRSNAELVAAMRDSRYATDEAYRKDVVNRMSVSTIL